MSKADKLKKILSIGTGAAKIFVPPSIGSLLDVVNKGIADTSDPANEMVLTEIAKVNDAQTEAIISLDARLSKLEKK